MTLRSLRPLRLNIFFEMSIAIKQSILCDLQHQKQRLYGITQKSYRKEWSLQALSGGLIELSGEGATARLTMAAKLVLDAQLQNEISAWIVRRDTSFFPPDLDAMGIDLNALVVVRPPVKERGNLTVSKSNDFRLIFRAAEQLLRSGAFGLVVMDLPGKSWMPDSVQMRLATLARRNDAVLLCLTEKSSVSPSLGSLVLLHAFAERKRIENDHFLCELRVLKDKRRRPGWNYTASSTIFGWL